MFLKTPEESMSPERFWITVTADAAFTVERRLERDSGKSRTDPLASYPFRIRKTARSRKIVAVAESLQEILEDYSILVEERKKASSTRTWDEFISGERPDASDTASVFSDTTTEAPSPAQPATPAPSLADTPVQSPLPSPPQSTVPSRAPSREPSIVASLVPAPTSPGAPFSPGASLAPTPTSEILGDISTAYPPALARLEPVIDGVIRAVDPGFFDSKLRTVLALIAYVVMCRYRLVIELMGLWVVIAAGRFWTASPPPETPEGTRKLRRLNAFAEWLASPRQTRFFLRAVHIAAALSLTKVIFRLCDASQEVLLSTAYGGCLYGGVYCILIHGLAVHFSLPQWIYDPIGEVLAVAPAEQAAPPLPPPPTPAVESSPVRSVSFAEQPAPPPAQPQPTALTLPPAVPNYPAPIVKALELENSSGWKLVSDKDGVTFEKKPVSWAPQQACRFVICMRAPLQFIAEFMNDRTKATEYDDLLEVTEEVEVLQPDGVVIYTSFRTPVAGVGKRDFLSEFRSVTISEDEWIQAAVNATHPRKPEQKGYVRGKIHLYSLMLKQFPDGRCRYKMLLSVDPRGWLPASAVDITNSKQIDKLKLLKRLIEGAYAASQAGQ